VDQYYAERKRVQKKLKSAKIDLDKLLKIADPSKEDLEKIVQTRIFVDQLNAKQLSIKIFCNSVYGCFGNKYSPIGDDDIASSITLTGQSTIKQSREIAKKFIAEKTGISDDAELNRSVIYGDTDSLFVSFFQVLSDFAEKGKPTKKAYDLVQEFENFLNVGIKNWAIKNLNSSDPRLEFKREVMCDSGILLQKKRYVLHILDKEGIQCDDWKYTGVEIVRTTMPKPIKPYVKKIIETMILTKNESQTNKVFKDAYDAFCLLDINDTALTSGIKNYEKYEQKCSGFNTSKGMPCHVKAAYYYNLLIKELGITNKYQSIKSGDKIKYFYVKKPNKYGIDAIAYKYEFPQEFSKFLEIDNEKMFVKDMYMCIERFYNTMGWIPRKPNDQLCNNLEDLFS
jgi:DNA polymerase elongation subunit (family B)